jgi:transmembrane sensor
VSLSRVKRPSWSFNGLWSNRPQLAALTAMAIIGIGIGAVFLFGADPASKTNGFYATAIGDQQTIALTDGSVVVLNTNTQIKVDYDREGRDVYLLQGEAHFSVAENEKQPFRVFAGVGRIRAVGTAFSVYLKGNKVDVTVTEGSVSLAAIPRSNESRPIPGGAMPEVPRNDTPVKDLGTLRAGQVATITSRTDGDLNRVESLENLREIAQPDISKRLSWTEGVLIFSGEPLEHVVQEISRYTTVNIEFSDPDVAAIRIGGRFPVGETDTMFDALQTNFGLHVTRLSHEHVLVSAGDQ